MAEITMSKKRNETARRIIKAVQESNGLLTLTAKKAGLHYATIWQYTQDFPTVKQAVVEAKERMLDFAEGKLYEKIKDGDNTAIIFYLKTQGKARGYIERQEVTGEGGGPVKVEHDVKDKIISAISRYASANGEGKGDSKPQ